MAAPSSSMAIVDFISQSGTMNLATATNVVFHYFLYFSSPFANFAKGLEIRLSLSPATLFSDVTLPNHTKMFELVHMVTSMEDFGGGGGGVQNHGLQIRS
jgi:hypothetical protein